MVPFASIVGMVFTAIISFLLPVILAIVFFVRYRYRARYLIVGALAFIASQILRSLFISIFLKSFGNTEFIDRFLFFFLIGSVSAGVFEESARYGGFQLLKKKEPQWADAVAFGIGHGGIEAILLVGLSQISNIVMSFMINQGLYDQVIAPQLGEQSSILWDALVHTAPSLFYMGGIERIFAITAHIFLSVFVCFGVIKKKPIVLFFSILIHALFNLPAVLFSYYQLNVYVIELIIGVIAILMFIGIRKLKPYFLDDAAEKHLEA